MLFERVGLWIMLRMHRAGSGRQGRAAVCLPNVSPFTPLSSHRGRAKAHVQVESAVWLTWLHTSGVSPRTSALVMRAFEADLIHFVIFIVAFAVMCSGITSASTASRAFAANLSNVFGLQLAGGIGITIVGLAFMALVAATNFRGVGESVKANVVLTCVELTGLLIVIFIGQWAIAAGEGDVSRVMQFKPSEPYKYNRTGFLYGIPVCVWVT